jgi:hypothetical protein
MDGRPSRGKDARLTLIVSCLTASQAIQVSDRRDTFGGEYSDYAHKALFFCGHVSLANMGLARIGELDSLEWLAHQLYKCADIHEVMERIPDRLTAEVGRGKDAGAQLGFFGVGWAQPPGSRADAELAPLFCSISNFQTSLREFTAQPTDDFRALEHVVEHPPFVHIAWGRETEQRELEEAVRALPDLDDPGAIAGPLVDYAKHHAAERAMVDPPGIVSQAFLVTSLPRIGAGGEPERGQPFDFSAGALGLRRDQRSSFYLRGPSDTMHETQPWTACPHGPVIVAPSGAHSTFEEAEAFFERLWPGEHEEKPPEEGEDRPG